MKRDSSLPPQIVAVGFRRINKMLQELAPAFHTRAHVEVVDVGFANAVTRVQDLAAQRPIDVVVAAGSNGAYLRQHLEMPVVLVKVGGFDVLQALALAKRSATQVGLVTYEGMLPDLSDLAGLLTLDVTQRTYRTEEEARLCVQELQGMGVQVVVGSGAAVDCAEDLGLMGVFLYSVDAVREALDDAVEVARASRIEWAKRERLNTILAQLSDGVIAVDKDERIQTLNPAMAHWLGIEPAAWVGRSLSTMCPELSLKQTLRLAQPELERIEKIKGKTLIANRMPIQEQGELTGAVLTCQDPISIQRVDRHLRSRAHHQTRSHRYELSGLVGDSAAMQQVRQLAQRYAASHATVLLTGESGTGKELIAQGIHQASDRRDMPFVAVNCAALSETLLESELFGYEEGAFTGARKGGKIGLIEAAHNGTLFLDEVGEMPLPLQTRLLRVLQEREVLRVGATELTPVNVRVIAATHQDLKGQVDRGLFRLDLYYRLNILRLDVPPLRERLGDIAAMARALQSKICHRLGLSERGTSSLLDALLARAQGYGWPGNVRELENLIERVMVYAAQPALASHVEPDQVDVMLDALVPELAAPERTISMSSAPSDPFADRIPRREHTERDACLHALAACGGDRGQAAQMLGISRTTLWRKLKGSV